MDNFFYYEGVSFFSNLSPFDRKQYHRRIKIVSRKKIIQIYHEDYVDK